ncbi:hypothetical protein TNCV_1566511 [Trichonephila clavipes]|nr:hypothetical protein TNCV_1566511 [Trichonephila clavipes]
MFQILLWYPWKKRRTYRCGQRTVRYTRAFGDGPRHFEPWSSDEDYTSTGTPSSYYHTPPTGGHLNSGPIKRASLPYTAGL